MHPFIVNLEATAAAVIPCCTGTRSAAWPVARRAASSRSFYRPRMSPTSGGCWTRFSPSSSLTSLGAPHDITLHELRAECFYPSEELMRRLAREPGRRRPHRTRGPSRSRSWSTERSACGWSPKTRRSAARHWTRRN